jgi:hypothetical protein
MTSFLPGGCFLCFGKNLIARRRGLGMAGAPKKCRARQIFFEAEKFCCSFNPVAWIGEGNEPEKPLSRRRG